ncbi:MAG: PEGA domain-containing protein [Labilithrix sp.]|nr:PEGA domain-containing protein [Labilithrix sp.]MBX3224807.1 PEGA domain-containing protein [Labilithrix sp.]
MRHGAVIVLSLSLFGCAAVFRGTKDKVNVESTPPGAEATRAGRTLGVTPMQIEVERSGLTQVTLTKSGFEDHNGVVKKQMNPAWLTLDILTCVFPVALCIPIIVDALTGAWYDVDHRYVATMKPGTAGATVAAAATGDAIVIGPTTTSTPAPAGPPTDMSESERKATARAAFLEGVKLHEAGNCAEALPRLEAAQKFFSAPTHLLHIAQCQAASGKLVESAETYETLVRAPLAKDGPEVFRQAQDEGKRELAQLKPRIPTLRVQITPAPSALSSLVVKLNGNAMPNEVLGIARPVNPGKYKVTVWAAGYKEASDTVDVGEGTPKAVELKLSK